jgi:hypothetical protein
MIDAWQVRAGFCLMAGKGGEMGAAGALIGCGTLTLARILSN